MTKTAEPIAVSDGMVVSMDYRLNLDNGERVDDSEDGRTTGVPARQGADHPRT